MNYWIFHKHEALADMAMEILKNNQGSVRCYCVLRDLRLYKVLLDSSTCDSYLFPVFAFDFSKPLLLLTLNLRSSEWMSVRGLSENLMLELAGFHPSSSLLTRSFLVVRISGFL